MMCRKVPGFKRTRNPECYNIEPDDAVQAYMNGKILKIPIISIITRWFLLTYGYIKRLSLEAYSRPRANGIIAINIREGDSLIEALLPMGIKISFCRSKVAVVVS